MDNHIQWVIITLPDPIQNFQVLPGVTVLFFLHLILFKYHLFTFKYTHPILFKAHEYLCLTIFEKPMIQVHGKTILSMEFKSIIKAYDSNPWQFIHPKPNSHWQHQSPILIGNTKAQFSLATSKSNSHWQHQSPIPIGNIKAQLSLTLFYQKEKSSRLSTLSKEKISC